MLSHETILVHRQLMVDVKTTPRTANDKTTTLYKLGYFPFIFEDIVKKMKGSQNLTH